MTTILRTALDGCVNCSVHSIPAEINYDGEANVSRYFDSQPTVPVDTTEQKSTFRGRPLKGVEVKIPTGYHGMIVTKKKMVASDKQNQTLHAEKNFDQFMLWNLEDCPSSNDVMQKTFDWLSIANVIHTPINADEEDCIKSSPDER